MLHEKAPDQKLCLSTNGLRLPDYIDEMVKYNVDHVTVTINSVDPTGEIGAKIYPWVHWNHEKVFGAEGAKILLEQQLKGIKMLTERGILVKANSVLIPGVNDKELVNVAKKLKELNVFLHNIMPLLSKEEYGTYYGLNGQASATDQEVMAAQEACGMDMKLMSHCRQCRADAVGLIGEDRGEEFTPDVFQNMSWEELQDQYNMEARAKKHEVISIIVRDHLEEKPPQMGFSSLVDPESGTVLEGDFNKSSVDAYTKRVQVHDHKLYDTFRKHQIRFTKVYTDSVASVSLKRLFEGR